MLPNFNNYSGRLQSRGQGVLTVVDQAQRRGQEGQGVQTVVDQAQRRGQEGQGVQTAVDPVQRPHSYLQIQGNGFF